MPTGDTTKTVYNLDGSESKNATTAARAANGAFAPDAVSTTKWDGKNKLIVTTITNPAPGPAAAAAGAAAAGTAGTATAAGATPPAAGAGGGRGARGPTESTTTFWLDGSELKINTSRPGAAGAPPTESLTIYKKGKG